MCTGAEWRGCRVVAPGCRGHHRQPGAGGGAAGGGSPLGPCERPARCGVAGIRGKLHQQQPRRRRSPAGRVQLAAPAPDAVAGVGCRAHRVAAVRHAPDCDKIVILLSAAAQADAQGAGEPAAARSRGIYNDRAALPASTGVEDEGMGCGLASVGGQNCVCVSGADRDGGIEPAAGSGGQ